MGLRAVAFALLLAPVCLAAPDAPTFEGGWKPPADLLTAAARLGEADPARRKAALEELDALPPRERVLRLRAGLRLADERAARACAARLKWTEVDEGESARIAALALPDLLRPGTEFDFDEVRSLFGTDDVGWLLEHLPDPPWAFAIQTTLAQLHRSVHAAHLPSLLRLARSLDAEVSREAAMDLVIALEFTDAHREAVAAWWAGDDWDASQDRLPPGPWAPSSGGLPLLLRRSLIRAWLSGFQTDRFHQMTGYLLRWLAEERPAEVDLPVLSRLAEEAPERVQRAAVRALARIPGDSAMPWLRAHARASEDPVGLEALAALARRGDPRALAGLAAFASSSQGQGSPHALALWAEVAPRDAGQHLMALLLSASPEVAARGFECLDEYHWFGGAVEEVPVPAALFEGAAEAAQAAARDGLTLARIGAEVPGARTRGLARAALSAWTARPPRGSTPEEAESLLGETEALAYLEAAQPEGLRALLRSWLDRETPDSDLTRTVAATLLLRLGDAESAERLLHTLEASPLGTDENWIQLAAIRAPEVMDALRRRAQEKPTAATLAALAVAEGLPIEVGLALAPFEEFSKFGDLVLAGHAVEALLALLTKDADYLQNIDVGLVRDPRVVSFLRTLRDQRENELYRLATEQLMLGGDAGARAELRRAYRAGRYRWIDETDPRILTLNRDLSTIPEWFDQLETNCCRAGTVTNIFDPQSDPRALFRMPGAYGFTRNAPWTPITVYRRWWAEVGPRLVWSRIANRFVEGPR